MSSNLGPSRAEGNPFRRFWDLGYRRLLPVVPCDAGIRYAGKRPGLLGGAGWYGTSVTIYDATLADLDRWMAMGADVGLRCDDGIFFIDIDTRASELAAKITALALEMLGPAKPRYGRKPKVALPYAGDPATNYRQARFDDGMDEKKPGLVELLAGPTKWAKTWGDHPDTRRPYEWPEGIPARHELTFVTAEQLDAFFAALAAMLPKWKGATGSSGIDRATVDQGTLRGDPALIRKAMEALPNNRKDFGYEEWVRVAIALRAALPEDENLALDLFADWTEKAGIEAPTEAPDRIFFSTPPPYGIGAGFIYDLAAKHSAGKFDRAEQWHEKLADGAAENERPRARRFVFESFSELAAASLQNLVPPLIKGVLDCGSMSVMYGESNSGKTFVALDMAFHAATGRPWIGKKTAHLNVAYIVAEGGRSFAKRIAGLRARHPDIEAPSMEVLRSGIDLLRADADLKPLISDLRALGRPIGFIVVDTLSRALAGGDENASTDMGALVKHMDILRAATGAHLMVIHHTGKNRAKGARGHSLLRAATDTEIEIADGRFTVTKQRDIERNFRCGFALDPICLGIDEDGDPINAATVKLLPDAEEASAPSVSPAEVQRRQDIARAAFKALGASSSLPFAEHHQSFGDALASAGIITGSTRPTILTALRALEGDGVEVEIDGQAVRVVCRKHGSGKKAPWEIVALKVPKEAENILSEGDESDENPNAFG